MRVQLVIGCGLDVQKMKSFTRWQLIVFYYYRLLNCSGAVHNCCSLIWTSFAIKTRLDLKFAIDDWSSSHRQSTLITSKCHHLDRAMLLLAFLGSRHPFRASYDWNSSQCDVPSRQPPTVPFPLKIVYGEQLFFLPSQRSEMEGKHHHF